MLLAKIGQANGGEWVEPNKLNPYRQAMVPRRKTSAAFWDAAGEALRRS